MPWRRQGLRSHDQYAKLLIGERNVEAGACQEVAARLGCAMNHPREKRLGELLIRVDQVNGHKEPWRQVVSGEKAYTFSGQVFDFDGAEILEHGRCEVTLGIHVDRKAFGPTLFLEVLAWSVHGQVP